MGCGCNNNIENKCKPKCQPTPCTCAVRLNSDCITVVGATTECSGIDDGLQLTDFLSQLDAFICTKFDDLAGFTTLKNIGVGSEVYKGIDGIGRKEIRRINAVGDIVTVTQNTDDISISIDEEALNDSINIDNVGTGVESYKGYNSLTNTHEFRTVLIDSQNGMGESFVRDVQQNTDDITVRVKKIKSDTLSITANDEEISLNMPSSATIPALYVNSAYQPTYEDWFNAGGNSNPAFLYRGEGTLARPFTNSRNYTSTVAFTDTPNTAIQNALDGHPTLSYVSPGLAGTRLSPNRQGEKIIIQESNLVYIFSGDFNYSFIDLKIEGTVQSTTSGFILDMDDNTAFDTTNARATIEIAENKVLEIHGLGLNNSGNPAVTSNFITGRICSLNGEGRIDSYYNGIDRYIVNCNTSNLVNNNDGNLCFDIRCKMRADYQGIYLVGGNGKVDFYNLLLSGTIVNTVNPALKAFHQTGGQVRMFEGADVNFFGGSVTPRTDVFTFTPTGFTPIFASQNKRLQGQGDNLYTKTAVSNVVFDVTGTSGAYGVFVTNIFESPNLWSLNFKNNILSSGIIDITKADLTQTNQVSSINTIGNNVIEILRIFDDRADAIANSVPLFSAYIKTGGVAYPTTTGWIRDIVLPA